MPFVKAMLTVRNRRPSQSGHHLAFATPEEWKDDFAIVDRYRLVFAREPRPRQGEDIAGVGLRVLDRALRDSYELEETVGVVRLLDAPLFVFVVRDRVTADAAQPIVVGAQQDTKGSWTLLRDWEIVKTLNSIADRPRSLTGAAHRTSLNGRRLLIEARKAVELDAEESLPFKLPVVEDVAGLLPADQ